MGIRNDSHHYGGDYEQFNRKFMRLVRGGVSARPWWDTSNPNERWAFAESNWGRVHILSKDKKSGDVRYIEAKARAQTGAIALTQNEWFKARRFKDDYYLYAVMNAATEPQLYIVQNPAENLEPEEKVEVVRYVVPFKDIVKKANETRE